jgi:hypothetical protein
MKAIPAPIPNKNRKMPIFDPVDFIDAVRKDNFGGYRYYKIKKKFGANQESLQVERSNEFQYILSKKL